MDDVLPLSSSENFSVRVGRGWFKWRSASPLPFFSPCLVALKPDFHWTGPEFLLPLTLALLAEGLRVWAVGFAGSATRTRGETVEDFVHAGPYRHVRNPLYVANILLYTACAVLFGFTWLSAALFGYSCIEYVFIVAFGRVGFEPHVRCDLRRVLRGGAPLVFLAHAVHRVDAPLL